MFIFTNCKQYSKLNKIKCSGNIESITNEIKQLCNAESVMVYPKIIKEETYLNRINAVVIMVTNSTTNILDFKKLTTKNQRFDNYKDIEDGLYAIGKPIAKKIVASCDLSMYKDLIVEFNFKDATGQYKYRFISHYKELL